MHITEHAQRQTTALSWLILDQTHQQVLHFLPKQNKIRKKHFTLPSLRRNRFDIGYVEKLWKMNMNDELFLAEKLKKKTIMTCDNDLSQRPS
jgi:hypothetical protein